MTTLIHKEYIMPNKPYNPQERTAGQDQPRPGQVDPRFPTDNPIAGKQAKGQQGKGQQGKGQQKDDEEGQGRY
jgi:hypothetical protein